MKIQSLIFKIYILMLPWMLFPFLVPIKNLFSASASISNNFFILIIGLIFLVLFNKGKLPFPKKSLVISGIKLCVFLNIISFFTSLVLYVPFGELNGENTLKASFPSIIYMFLTAIVFYYNATMFQIVEKRIIIKILNFLSIILLLIGLLQVLVLNVPGIAKIYDILNFMDILRDSYRIQSMWRICFSGSEPASVGCIVTIFILPYLLSQILETKFFKYKLCAASFIFFCFFTYSSTVYTGSAINVLVFIFLYVNKYSNKKQILKVLILLCFVSLFLLLFGNYIWHNTTIGRNIQELLVYKTTSQENLSTLVRYSTIKTDLQAFILYPLTGVGNGNQGYFYNQVIEKSMLVANVLQYSEFSSKIDGDIGIINGGSFLPAFISGYGLLGIILLFLFIRKCILYMHTNPNEYGCFRYMYYIGGTTFLVLSAASTSLDGNFINMFIISIPLCKNFINKKRYVNIKMKVKNFLPITVGIPTLNRPKSLKKTLESYFSYDYIPMQMIIVDQTNDEKVKDENKRIINSLNKYNNIFYYYQKEASSTVSRNKIIQEAKNEILIFSDDDININKDTLLNIFNLIQNKKISMIAGQDELSPKAKGIIGYLIGTKSFFNRKIGHVTSTMLGRYPNKIKGEVDTQWAMGYFFVVRKSLVDKWNLTFDENLRGYAYNEDLDFSFSYYKYAKKENLKCILSDKVIVKHLSSREYRVSSKRHIYAYVVNRLYLSYKHKKGSLSRFYMLWGNLVLLFFKIIKKEKPIDMFNAIVYSLKNRKKIEKGEIFINL